MLVKRSVMLLIGLLASSFLLGFGQEESPLPGVRPGQVDAGAPAQRQVVDYLSPAASNSAPVPGQAILNNQAVLPEAINENMDQEKEKLPISIEGIKAAVEDMKGKAARNEPVEESVNKYLNWLDGLIRAHNKLAGSFAKQDRLQVACETERDLSRRLYQIKDQVLYLKAQALIKSDRWAQAMPILVDIAAVEPQSPLGQAAYLRLKQAGFSPETIPAISQAGATKKDLLIAFPANPLAGQRRQCINI